MSLPYKVESTGFQSDGRGHKTAIAMRTRSFGSEKAALAYAFDLIIHSGVGTAVAVRVGHFTICTAERKPAWKFKGHIAGKDAPDNYLGGHLDA